MKVIILSGLPGSGKSTWWKKHYPSAMVVSADGFMREQAKLKGFDYDNGGEGFDRTILPAAHQNCFRRFLVALGAEFETIVVDNTNLSAWEIAPYMLAGESYGYSVEIVRIHCDAGKAASRNVHGVPAHAYPTLLARFNSRDILPWWKVSEIL